MYARADKHARRIPNIFMFAMLIQVFTSQRNYFAESCGVSNSFTEELDKGWV